jgi:hypothetical protein
VLAARGLIGLLPGGDSGGHSGESMTFLCTRGFRHPRHGCRYKDVSNPQETFLKYCNANIDVGAGEILLNINGEEE